MSDPATVTWVGQPGLARLSSAKQSIDRLVWVEEEAVMPQPVLQTAGAQRQLCKVG